MVAVSAVAAVATVALVGGAVKVRVAQSRRRLRR